MKGSGNQGYVLKAYMHALSASVVSWSVIVSACWEIGPDCTVIIIVQRITQHDHIGRKARGIIPLTQSLPPKICIQLTQRNVMHD